MPNKILVIGVGAEGVAPLAPTLKARIVAADWLVAGERLLRTLAEESAPKPDALRITLKSNIAEVVARLHRRGEARVVVLASGDPGFFGIAGTLLREFPAQEIEIVPQVSSLQLAFARARIDWSDAILTSAHARPLAEVVSWAHHAHKLGILTDSQHTPAVIAKAMFAAGIEDCRAIVAENLDLPEERLTDTCLSDLLDRQFAPLNVLLLIHDAIWAPRALLAPRPDAAYAHRSGLITKADVRTLSLARLALRETDTAWDIGAGSGAVSIEMAELAWRGCIYAVERDPENLGFLRANVTRYGALNVEVVPGSAPEALAGLPAPNAVFIGGTGGSLAKIIAYLASTATLGCRVVVNLATLEHLQQTLSMMRDLAMYPELTQVNLAHGEPIAQLTRLVPLNPVFIVSGVVSRRPVSSEQQDE
jgi:precorrin-6Y C5,15-methyltransferase (decarboxylating)